MANLRMARQGTSFTEGDFGIAWGLGPGAVREVVDIPENKRTGRLRGRIASGYIEETDEEPTKPPSKPPASVLIHLSEIPADGQGIVFNSDTNAFDPAPKAAALMPIDLPENATAEDVAQAFNDMIEVLVEANVMESPPS